MYIIGNIKWMMNLSLQMHSYFANDVLGYQLRRVPQSLPQLLPPVESLFEDNSQTKRILEFCTSPKGILEIADMLGYTQKKSVRKYLKPLVEQGRLAMTIPDRPNSSSQKYVTVR